MPCCSGGGGAVCVGWVTGTRGLARSSSAPWAKVHLSPYGQCPALTNLAQSLVFRSAGSGPSPAEDGLGLRPGLASRWATRSGGRTRSSCSPWAKLQCSPSRHWLLRHLCVEEVVPRLSPGVMCSLDADTGLPIDALAGWQAHRKACYVRQPLHCVGGNQVNG